MSDLVKLNDTDLQKGGLGFDTASKLFKLKPSTISIDQPMTEYEDSEPGKLRIRETGQKFSFMQVVLLSAPVEHRQYYIGDKNDRRNKENMLCFSLDMIKPDARSKEKQAFACKNCPHADWSKWRETRKAADLPACEAYYVAYLIDTEFNIPLQLYVKGASKKPFEAGMQRIAQTAAIMQSQGKNPNIFDITFRLGTEKGNNKNFVLKISDPKEITSKQREMFGTLYLDFINRDRKSEEDMEDENMAEEAMATQKVVEKEMPIITGEDIPF